MTGAHLVKLFAWVIGALVLLWMLVQCMGAPQYGTGPGERDSERDSVQRAADCGRAWDALELMGEADHGNVDAVVDEIGMLADEIVDRELSRMVYAFAERTEEMVAAAEEGDAAKLEDTYLLYRGLVEVDLSLKCSDADTLD